MNVYDATLIKDAKKLCSPDSRLSQSRSLAFPHLHFHNHFFIPLSLCVFLSHSISHPFSCTPRYIISYITQFIMCISLWCIHTWGGSIVCHRIMAYKHTHIHRHTQNPHTHTQASTHKWVTLKKWFSFDKLNYREYCNKLIQFHEFIFFVSHFQHS